MEKARITGWITLFLGIVAFPVWACNIGSVRDAAFQGDRNMHRLCVIANADDASADAIHARLKAWLDGFDNEMNIELTRATADDPALRWQSLGLPSAPPSVPVVTLVGLSPATRLPFVIDHWDPAPTDADLAALQTSPAREAIKARIPEAWAVLLYSPAAGSDSQRIQATLDTVAVGWKARQPSEIAIVQLDRSDPRERLLRLFTGITPSGPDWVGVVFGRGKLLAPPLVGPAINEANLNKLLEGLAVPCTCLQDSTALGLDLPMTWSASLDSRVTAFGTATGYVEIPVEERLAALEEEVVEQGYIPLYWALIPLLLVSATAVGAVVAMIRRARRGSGVAGAE